MSEDLEITTPDGQFRIPAADLEGYRIGDAPEPLEEGEVEGFASRRGQPITKSRLAADSYLSLKLGSAPIVRTNSYVLFSGETMEGAPF